MRINIITVAAIVTASFANGQLGGVPQLPNAPFSAEVVETRVQTLADGTHISQPEYKTRVYRDSLGRTRSESPVAPPGVPPQTPPLSSRVVIVDPVDGASYVLDTSKKAARKNVLQKRAQPPTLPPVGSPGQASQAALGSIQAVTPPGMSALIVNGQGPGAGSGGPNSAPTNGTGVTVGKSCPNPCPGAFTRRNEILGTQNMEGLVVEGRRQTDRYAVGNIGNDREVVIYNEVWRSTELGITVLSKNFDPRTGERTTKATNVSRTEPDPALFQVPADYTIEERPAPGAAPSAQNK